MMRSKTQTELITGLDIGSTGIRVAVGQVFPEDRNTPVQIIATAEVASEGIHRGNIVSIEEAVSSVTHALEEVDRLVGVPIESAWIGVSGTQILSQESRGVIAVAKTDGEISYEDVSRVLDAAKTVASPLNYEVLHVLPKTFTVDGQMGIKDPVGMTGIRLEVDAQMIYGASPYVKNVSKAVYRTGIDIDDLVLSVIATADVVLTSKQKELGVAVVDIGGSTTTVAVFEEGNVLKISVIPIGSNHITNDLALGLQTSIEVAERIKLTFGSCISAGLTKLDKIDLAEIGEEGIVSKKFVAEIIEARAIELLERVNEELASINRGGLLPAGLVFTGGGAKLQDLVDLAKQVLRMNAAYGFPHGIQSATDKVNDLAFTTAIGLVKWGADAYARYEAPSGFKIPGGAKAATQMRKLFKFLIP